MRTRIALRTAAIVAVPIVSIVIIIITCVVSTPSFSVAGASTGARPSAVTRAAMGHEAVLTASPADSGTTPSRIVLSAAAAWRDRVALLEQMVAAWRAANPTLAPPPASLAAASASTPAPPVTDATSTTTPDWACIRLHESGDRYNTPTAPGGAYGFLEKTWLSIGESGWPYEAPAWVQAQAALFLYSELGWQPWSTRYVCGL